MTIDNPMSPQEQVHMMREMLNGLRGQLNRDGVMVTEPSIRRGRLTDISTTLCTPDYSDKTTWYQSAIHINNEIVESIDNKNFQFLHYPIINADSPRLYARDTALSKADGTWVDRSEFRLIVKIDDQIVLSGDSQYSWTINYLAGLLTFGNPVPSNKTVKVDYYYVPEHGGSRYILRPPDGYRLIIEHVEVQFSVGTNINDDIVFELGADVHKWVLPDKFI